MMTRHGLVRGCALLLALPLSIAASAQPTRAPCTPGAVAAIAQDVIAKATAGKSEPGVTLAISVPLRWRTPVAVASGFSDYERRTPMRPDARMLAGSVGKTFFGAAAFKLAQDGRLDLDRPIGRILTGIDIPGGDVVTTRMLLSHTSGYGEYDGPFMDGLIADPLRTRILDDWVGPLRRNAPGKPGVFRYSDINYVLVAEIISKTAGEPWQAYIERSLLRPFGLRDTVAALTPAPARLTAGYAGARSLFGRDAMMGGGRLIYNPQFESGGGGFVSTAPDLARWIVRLGTGNVHGERDWRLATTPVKPADDKGDTYGMGIHIQRTPAGTAYGHSGYIPGYISWVRYYERPAIGIAMQTNTSDDARLPWDGYDLMDEIVGKMEKVCPSA
ncbi:serine hydrolase domain-containing protein [Sphingomonas sp. 1P06PA]|uniref:serine hydrolase domain-containing protein n=1 Tax=Sphingomonas sp. 1P06PA TaxID=554121 RepID=UPI0039A49ACA